MDWRGSSLTRQLRTLNPQHWFTTVGISHKQKQTYQTGCLNYNKSQSILIYEKNAEKATYGVPVGPSPLLRVEWQVKKSQSAKQKTGIRTVNDVMTRFGGLEALYAAAMQKNYFKWDVGDFRSARRFPKGAVTHQLERILKKLQTSDSGSRWTSDKLYDALNKKGESGLAEKLKASAKRMCRKSGMESVG